MSERVIDFQPRRDYLICVDSDGCALDTMVVKHMRCFGPALVKEWELEPWGGAVLAQWNELNLYTRFRGCNRFYALADILAQVDRQFTPVPGLNVLRDWVTHAPQKSNDALRQAVEEQGHTILCKALAWSEAVNAAVARLSMDDMPPFPGVSEGITAAHEVADVVVLSGSNHDAVMEEWDTWGLLQDVDLVVSQEDGTKRRILSELLEKGYAPEHVLVIGDDPGDAEAAQRCGVYFYPIRVRWEGQDWLNFPREALPMLMSGAYAAYGRQRYRQFMENLQG